MEEPPSELDNYDTNFLCLICGSSVNEDESLHEAAGTGILKQLNVMFLLKNVLQIPNNQLIEFLKNYGNPDNWISLCDQCTLLTGEARELHCKIAEITRELKGRQKELVQKVKSSIDTLSGEDGRSRINELRGHSKMTVWRETRMFVKYFLDSDDLDNLCLEDPILEANNFIKELESRVQNEVHFLPTLELNPKTEIELEDNHTNTDNFDDFLPGTPTHIQDTLDDPDSDWLPPPSSPCPSVPPSSVIKDNPPKTPKPKGVRIRKRKGKTASLPTEEIQKCQYCSIQVPSMTSLLRHFQTDHGMDKLPCLRPGCKKILSNIKQYFKHRQRHKKQEAEQVLIKSENEDNPFNSAQDNNQENHVDAVMESSIKNEDTQPVDNFDPEDNHEDINSEEEDDDDDEPDNAATEPGQIAYKPKPQKCPECFVKFSSITTTLKHLAAVHKRERLPCLHRGCSKTVKNIRQYFKHHSTHLRGKRQKSKSSQPKPTVRSVLCDLCGASFVDRKGLYHHLVFFHERRPRKDRISRDITCHVCGLVVKSNHLKIHMLRLHKDALGEEGEGKTLLQCRVVGCKRWYLKKESLDKHIEKTHGGWDGKGEPPKDAKPTFVCGICGMGFYFKGRLEIHELLHQGKVNEFSCNLCGKGFGTEKHLNNHKKFKRCKMEERVLD